MASRTIVACDLCGKEPADTVRVAVDAASYEVDLCGPHRKAMNTALKPFVKAARESPRAARAKATIARPVAPRATRTTTRRSRRSVSRVAEIRTWGQANGFAVAAKGRLKPEVVEAYDNAHKAARAKKA